MIGAFRWGRGRVCVMSHVERSGNALLRQDMTDIDLLYVERSHAGQEAQFRKEDGAGRGGVGLGWAGLDRTSVYI